MSDLANELRSAALAVRTPDVARIRAMGLLNPGLLAVNERRHPFGIASISDAGRGQYVPDPDGGRAMIVPVHEGDELVDLLAFHTLTPERWLLRLGLGWALGLEESLERYRWGDPLPLHKTPLDWFKAGCDGLCVIDWEAPEVRTLTDFPTLLIRDEALERRTIAALTKPYRLPRIAKDVPLAA